MLKVSTNVLGYLAANLGGVFDAVATDLVDVIPQTRGKSAEGIEMATAGAPRNGATPLPAVIRETTGREIYIAAQRRFVVGCYATLPAIYKEVATVVENGDLLRAQARDGLPVRTFQVEHVGDQAAGEIALVVTRVRS